MPKVEAISSAANPLLKDIRRAIAHGSLTSEGLCVAESFHLLAEAQRSGCEVAAVLATGAAARRLPRDRTIVLPDALFAGIAATENSQGVVALVRPPAWTWADLFAAAGLVVALDGVQDPGNAGTIVRAAEAFGAAGVCFLKGSVSPFNAKTLRASAGSLFRLPFVHGMDAAAALAAFQRNNLALYAAVPSGGAPLAEVNLRRPCALTIGSEGRGISAELRSAAAGLTIPTRGVESLNAALAAGIVLYEAHRQKEPRA